MPIIVNLDVMMARRKISLNELAQKVDLTLANLSILKTGKQELCALAHLSHSVMHLNASREISWNLKKHD